MSQGRGAMRKALTILAAGALIAGIASYALAQDDPATSPAGAGDSWQQMAALCTDVMSRYGGAMGGMMSGMMGGAGGGHMGGMMGGAPAPGGSGR